MLRRLGNLFTGGLFDSAIIPEMSSGSQAKYKTDLELWKEQQKLALVDPQDYALAAGIRAGADPRELAALQVESAGATAWDGNPTTLGRGQVQIDPFGNQTAAGPEYTEALPAAVKTAQETARNLGIPTKKGEPGSEFYSRLIAAYAEPVQEVMDGEGNVSQINTIQQVLSDWKSWQQQQTEAQATPQEPSPVPETATANPIGVKTHGPITKGLNEKQAQLVTDAPEKLEFYDKYEKVLMQAISIDPQTGEMTVNEDFLDLYGSWDGNPLNPTNWGSVSGPEGEAQKDYWFKSGAERDMDAISEQLVNMLTVDERGKLKGQGQITEGETAMLRAAVTKLKKRGMSDKAVMAELQILYEELQRKKQEQVNMIERYWDGNSEYYNSRSKPTPPPPPPPSSNKTPTPVGNDPIVIDLDAR
jgi:hypothetical protein